MQTNLFAEYWAMILGGFIFIVKGLAHLLELFGQVVWRLLFRRARTCGRCSLWSRSEPSEGTCSRSGIVHDSACVCPYEVDRADEEEIH